MPDFDSLQQTRDSIGHRDQTKDLVFAGTAKEKIKARVVNEVIRKIRKEGFILGDSDRAVLGSDDLGLDWEAVAEEVLRRRWDWTDYNHLKKSPVGTGTLTESSVQINLSD